MHRITDIKALEGFRVWIKFSDNVEGVVDLSDVAGKGVFSVWKDRAVFEAAFIDPVSHTAAWPGGIDLCPDSLYAELTGTKITSQLTHA